MSLMIEGFNFAVYNDFLVRNVVRECAIVTLSTWYQFTYIHIYIYIYIYIPVYIYIYTHIYNLGVKIAYPFVKPPIFTVHQWWFNDLAYNSNMAW